MSELRVVGAGIGRTGTTSLKLALDRLLGAPCYQMQEVFTDPSHVPMWHEAVRGRLPNWDELFEGYVATVDWPSAAFWRELADAYPDAPILLSARDAEDWWRSCDHTIWEVMRRVTPGEPFDDMVTDLMRSFTANYLDRDEAMAAFERHNDAVRSSVPRSRLVEWRPGDGWEPLCEMLGVDVPDEAFPHVNSTQEFRHDAGMD
jgi:hypothetical protein